MLDLYRRLIALRRARPALAVGDHSPLTVTGDVLAFARDHRSERLAVALNLGSAPHDVGHGELRGRILLSTHGDREGEAVTGELRLRADEGVIVDPGAAGETQL
jgi:alpha-glucosidase